MPSKQRPPVEWLATTAAHIYTARFAHFLATSNDEATFDVISAISDCVETASDVWAAAAASTPDPPQPSSSPGPPPPTPSSPS